MELIFIVVGAILGISGLLAVQWLYQWIASMHTKIESVKWELDRYQRIREDWVEFTFWKNERKKETNK